jgi:hypothetical protein
MPYSRRALDSSRSGSNKNLSPSINQDAGGDLAKLMFVDPKQPSLKEEIRGHYNASPDTYKESSMGSPTKSSKHHRNHRNKSKNSIPISGAQTPGLKNLEHFREHK